MSAELRESLAAFGVALTENHGVKWSFSSFAEEVGRMRAWMNGNVPLGVKLDKPYYFEAQQMLLEQGFACALRLDSQRIGPYLDIAFSGCGTVIAAKCIILFETVQGAFLRKHGVREERFNLPVVGGDVTPLIKLLREEALEPSFNFCTIFGDDFR